MLNFFFVEIFSEVQNFFQENKKKLFKYSKNIFFILQNGNFQNYFILFFQQTCVEATTPVLQYALMLTEGCY